MELATDPVFAAVFIGCFATVAMDLWSIFLKRVFSIQSLDYRFVGRWLRHMPSGSFKHASIASATPKSAERMTGWVAHYATGIAFAAMFLSISRDGWIQRPTLIPALSFGIATVLFPFLIMQPAFGLGIAAAKAPHPGKARSRSLMTHAVFGMGMYLGALVLARFFRLHA